MTTGVEVTEAALDDLEELEKETRQRIISKLEDVTDFPEHYLDGLSNFPGDKIRVGDFRLITDRDREEEVIYVVAVLERKHDYRELSSLGEVWENVAKVAE